MARREGQGEGSRRRSSWLDLLDSLDLAIYGALGLGFLLYAVFLIGQATWESGSAIAFALFSAFVGLTMFAIVRDIRRRKASGPTKAFLALWLLSVLIIGALEFSS